MQTEVAVSFERDSFTGSPWPPRGQATGRRTYTDAVIGLSLTDHVSVTVLQ